MMKSQTIQSFEDFIQTEKTRDQYYYHLNKFRIFNNLESIEQILFMGNQDLQEKIQDYVRLFKEKGRNPNYIRGITFAIQSLCDSNDKIGINWKKIRKMLGKKQKSKTTRPYTTAEIKRMLHSVKHLRNKSIILFLSASGVRRGALPVLKMRDLKQMPNGCLSITVYEGSNDQYITFINKESNESLSLYIEQRKHRGEIITPDSPVFTAQYTNGSAKPKTISEASISNMILRAKTNAGVNFDNAPNLLCHAFRRRFNTILKLNKEINPTMIERLMGHDMQLDNSYFQPTLENIFEEYQKGMADLTIDDSERLLAERKSIEAQKTQLDIEKQEREQMKQQMTILAENQSKMNHIMSMIKNGEVKLVGMDNEKIMLDLIQ